MAPSPDDPDKIQAAVLIENAHGLWIRGQTFIYSHDSERRKKEWWFKQLARTALIAAVITVILSAFGFTQDQEKADNQSTNLHTSENSNTSGEHPKGLPVPSGRVIWLLTGLCGALAAIAKLGEQHIGRPEDIQSHLHAALTLSGKMDTLKMLVARITGYYDGTQSHELQELTNQYDVLNVEISETGKLVGVSPTEEHETNAKEAISGNSIDIALSHVMNPEEIPDDAVGIDAPVRGGG